MLSALPLATSLYVLGSTAWLLPDNLGWLALLAVLIPSFRPRATPSTILLASAALLALVFIRQIHLWAAAVIWTSAYLGPWRTTRASENPCHQLPTRIRHTIPAMLATLPAFALVGIFALIWGGLTPPHFHDQYAEPNPAAPAFILALIAGYSFFFLPTLIPPALAAARSSPRRAALIAAAALAATLVVATIPETSHNVQAGRYSGLWNLVAKLPAPADRSPLIIALALAGSTALLMWSAALRPRDRWLLLATLTAFAAAQTASHELWQRYNEPLLLILFPLFALRVQAQPRRTQTAFLILLVITMTAISATQLTTGRHVARPNPAPSIETPATP